MYTMYVYEHEKDLDWRRIVREREWNTCTCNYFMLFILDNRLVVTVLLRLIACTLHLRSRMCCTVRVVLNKRQV